ncbi:hypothetical protein ANO14919_056020 [Xylariales sp. No.14919]|nr:hypothetical protein ANO14919_056020 [Xylariales sp. No.14919]
MADEVQETQETNTVVPEASALPGSVSEAVKSYEINQTIFRENEGKLGLVNRPSSTIGDLLALLEANAGEASPEKSSPEGNIFRIFFLPVIHEEDSEGGGVISKCSQPLAKALHVDPFFLTKRAWDSNGFFMSQTHQQGGSPRIQSHASRLLIKFLKKKGGEGGDDRPDYGWMFLSFCAICFKHSDKKKDSHILVCFDHSSRIKDAIESAFEGYLWEVLTQNLLSVHEALLRHIIWEYDRALWLFRKPIRDIENGRDKFLNGLDTDDGLVVGNRTGVMTRYDDMHEYARHVVHSSETLQAASAVAMKMIDHFQMQSTSRRNDDSGPDNILSGLHFSSQFLMNLKLRADAFKERLDNEIQLSYNVVSLYQLQDTKRLLEGTRQLLKQSQETLEQTRDDGKDMTTAVTSLSLLFLPASFAASFWGMNFIGLKDGGTKIEFSSDLWMFYVSAVGLVVVSVLLWVLIHYLGWEPSLRSGKIFRFKRGRAGP